MGRNVNKQSRICGPDIFNKFFFSCHILHMVTLYDVNNSDLKDTGIASSSTEAFGGFLGNARRERPLFCPEYQH